MGKWEEGSRGKGIYIYLQLIHIDVQQKTTQNCKTIFLQLKKKKQLNQVLEDWKAKIEHTVCVSTHINI